MFGRKKPVIPPQPSGEPGQAGNPVQIYRGRVTDPSIVYNQLGLETAPFTYQRYNNVGRHDVQLFNGWQNTSMGRIIEQPGVGYLNLIRPTTPGLDRLSNGPQPSAFIPRGSSRQQEALLYQQTQPFQATIYGPGDVPPGVVQIINPGSGA